MISMFQHIQYRRMPRMGAHMPPMMQLGQSLHASSLYLTCVLLARLTVLPITQFVQSPHTSSFYLTRVLLTRTTAGDTAACAVSERLGILLDPGSSSRHEPCRRCYSLCNLHTWLELNPRSPGTTNCTTAPCAISARLGIFTRPGFSSQARTVRPILQVVWFMDASGLYSTRVILAGTY